MVNDPDRPAQGRFVGGEHRYPLRVHFEDTDLSGVVYHANYLRFMERARSDMLRLAGVDQRGAMERGEGAYALVDLAIRYRAPARLDDVLVVASRVEALRAATATVHQRVMRGGVVLTESTAVVALVGPDGRPRRQPKDWLARMGTAMGEAPQA